MAPDQPALTLPVSVVGLVDVGRLLRELDRLETTLQQASVGSEGKTTLQLPKLTLLLDQFVEQNKLDLIIEDNRKQAITFLHSVKLDAPKVHMSFSSNPSNQFMLKLTGWLRQNTHPQVLITVGLQPGIGAGCVLRTTNKYFDLSLAKSFASSRDLLMKRLRAPTDDTNQSEVDALQTGQVATPEQGVAV